LTPRRISRREFRLAFRLSEAYAGRILFKVLNKK